METSKQIWRGRRLRLWEARIRAPAAGGEAARMLPPGNGKALLPSLTEITEVYFLGRLSHPNLVKLLGYCVADDYAFLVYEFMARGSLEIHLYRRGTNPLPWSRRVKILIGAARGLAFLHSLERPVIHGNFKTSKILLDSDYNAKLSDLSLAKDGPDGGLSHVSTRVMGTHGYAAPEYVATGHLSVKSDVYSFGVVMLEVLSGQRAFDANRPIMQQNLVDWARPYLEHRRRRALMLRGVMDSRLEGQYSSKGVVLIARLALGCLQNDPKNRPSMNEVVDALRTIDPMNNKAGAQAQPLARAKLGAVMSPRSDTAGVSSRAGVT